MALVKEAVYKKWFSTDHWMYKQFSYIFENPLWSKNVPSGFSLCPYFWMSILIGFIGLRLFLVPALLAIKYMIGNTFGVAEEKCRDIICRHLENHERRGSFIWDLLKIPGGLVMFVCFYLLMVMALHFLGLCTGTILAFAYMDGWTSLVAGILVIVTIAVGICLAWYKDKHKYEENICRVDVYLTLCVLSTIGWWCVVFHEAIWREIIVEGVWNLFCCFFIGGIAMFIWNIICFLVLGILHMVTTAPSGFPVPYSVMIIAAWLVASMVLRKVIMDTPKNLPSAKPEYASVDEIKQLLTVYFLEEENLKNMQSTRDRCFKDFPFGKEHPLSKSLRRYIVSSYLETKKELMKLLPEIKLEKSDYRRILKSESSGRGNGFRSLICDGTLLGEPAFRLLGAMDEIDFWETSSQWTKKMVKQFQSENAAAIEIYLDMERRRHATSERRKARCHATTGILRTIFYSPVVLVRGLLGRIARIIWEVVCYMGDILKSKKQGWCPYIRFEKKGEKSE